MQVWSRLWKICHRDIHVDNFIKAWQDWNSSRSFQWNVELENDVISELDRIEALEAEKDMKAILGGSVKADPVELIKADSVAELSSSLSKFSFQWPQQELSVKQSTVCFSMANEGDKIPSSLTAQEVIDKVKVGYDDIQLRIISAMPEASHWVFDCPKDKIDSLNVDLPIGNKLRMSKVCTLVRTELPDSFKWLVPSPVNLKGLFQSSPFAGGGTLDQSSTAIESSSVNVSDSSPASLKSPIQLKFWGCKKCNFRKNEVGNNICQACNHKGKGWSCTACTASNLVGVVVCVACNSSKQRSEAILASRKAVSARLAAEKEAAEREAQRKAAEEAAALLKAKEEQEAAAEGQLEVTYFSISKILHINIITMKFEG
jgi:hypothetical protein